MTLCEVCGEPFTGTEWDERHTAPDGEDIHERCCYCREAQPDDGLIERTEEA